jgi:hypothetical protein
VAAALISTNDAFASKGGAAARPTPPSTTPRPEAEAKPVPDLLPVAPGRVHPVVVLYGDSLAWESQANFSFTLTAAGAEVHARTFGGTAICDFLDTMRKDAFELRPDAVVVEFSGNAMSPCMRDERPALAGLEPFEAYRIDATELLGIFSNTRVYFAGSPRGLEEEKGEFHGGSMNDLYRELAAAHGNARYVDAGASVLDDGRWTKTLPCLPAEPCGGTDSQGRGVNVVRAPDGAHFCPQLGEVTNGVTDTCAVWSSGAYRFGLAMAGAVAHDLP